MNTAPRAALDSDTALLVDMFDGILSDGEREKLRELRELAKARMDVRVRSMKETRELFDRAKSAYEAAIAEKKAAIEAYDESTLELAPDDDDDWETASKKNKKLEKIEAEFLEADSKIEKARKEYLWAGKRVDWELREGRLRGYIDEDPKS
jgi:hypothetical protein